MKFKELSVLNRNMGSFSRYFKARRVDRTVY